MDAVALFGAALYPNLIVSSLNPAWSLTLESAASSDKTLGIMAFIAGLGLPFVLAYTGLCIGCSAARSNSASSVAEMR